MKINKSINIKGEVCPYTFVKTRLALEQLSSGQILEVIIDYEPAFRNIPTSLEDEGHKILEKEKINETDYRLVIQKK